MSPKLTRLVLAASVAAAFAVAPMSGAYAAERTVFVEDDRFVIEKVEDGIPTFDALPGDTIKWEVGETKHEHTVTPKNDEPKPSGGTFSPWPAEVEPSGTLKSNDEFKVTFPQPGRYYFFCENHVGMRGVINVKDQEPAPPPPPPPTTTSSSTTTTTRVPMPGPTTTTTAVPAGPAGVKPAAPATTTTTTTSKDKKKDSKDDKKDETTTTTLPPPPPPVDIPDSAIIPSSPDFSGTTTQNGIEAPDGAPEGDAIALLKSKKGGGGGKAMKLLIVSGLGLGALGIGTAGYKYANRSSKYFPA